MGQVYGHLFHPVLFHPLSLSAGRLAMNQSPQSQPRWPLGFLGVILLLLLGLAYLYWRDPALLDLLAPAGGVGE